MASVADGLDNEKMIMLSADRMAFGGPQVPSDLLLGGFVIYTCVEGPFELTVNGVRSERHFAAIVPPYVRHNVVGPPSVRSILAEAETVSSEILNDGRFRGAGARALAHSAEAGFLRWENNKFNPQRDSFDLFFFGEPLPQRRLDSRIEKVLHRIEPSSDGLQIDIGTLAREVALSPSRLRHLFCEQVGIPIRSYRAWKRLRNAICLSLNESNLLQLAMAAGYADSTHLCHSVKLYFGEQPTFVCTHWRSADFLQIEASEIAPHTEPANDMLDTPYIPPNSNSARSVSDSSRA